MTAMQELDGERPGSPADARMRAEHAERARRFWRSHVPAFARDREREALEARYLTRVRFDANALRSRADGSEA